MDGGGAASSFDSEYVEGVVASCCGVASAEKATVLENAAGEGNCVGGYKEVDEGTFGLVLRVVWLIRCVVESEEAPMSALWRFPLQFAIKVKNKLKVFTNIIEAIFSKILNLEDL